MEGVRFDSPTRFMPARLLIAVVAVLYAGLALTATARADEFGSSSTGASVDKGGVTVHAAQGSAGSPQQAAQGPSGPYWCPVVGDPEFVIACGVPLRAPNCPISVSTGILSACDATHSLPGTTGNAADVARQAESRLAFALPTASMAPPPNSVVVNFPTWLWVAPSAWHTLSATAAAGGVSATATAEPARVVWNMGDGNSVICFGPGAPWTSAAGSASSNFQNAYGNNSYAQPNGLYNVTSTIYWHVTWIANGAGGGGDFGLVAGPSTTTTVHVGEIHSINVASSG